MAPLVVLVVEPRPEELERWLGLKLWDLHMHMHVLMNMWPERMHTKAGSGFNLWDLVSGP